MSKGNFVFNTLSGKLGQMVLYRTDGEQRQRTYVAQVKNPRTRKQMQQRVQWSNCVVFYRNCAEVVRPLMLRKKEKQSSYNRFMQLNLNRVPVYLTKEQSQANASVCAPYVVADGSLSVPQAVVKADGAEDYIESPLFPQLSKPLATMTLGDWFAQIAATIDLRVGDRISFIAVYKRFDLLLQSLECAVTGVCVDFKDTRKVTEIFPYKETTVGKKAVLTCTNLLGVTAILTRKTSTGNDCNTAAVAMTRKGAAALSSYQTSSWLNQCIDSWGPAPAVGVDPCGPNYDCENKGQDPVLP